jgi:hypothetical protein
MFMDQMPIYLVLKNGTFYAGIKNFHSLPPSMTIIKKNKAKIQSSFKKIFKYTIVLLYIKFLCLKVIYNVKCL